MLTPAQYRDRIKTLTKNELKRVHRYWVDMKSQTPPPPEHRTTELRAIDSFILAVEEVRYDKDPDYRAWRNSLSDLRTRRSP